MIAVLYWMSEPPGDLLWSRVAWWAIVLFAAGISLAALGGLAIGWKSFSPKERFQLFMLALFL